jgi:hypothetical protein
MTTIQRTLAGVSALGVSIALAACGGGSHGTFVPGASVPSDAVAQSRMGPAGMPAGARSFNNVIANNAAVDDQPDAKKNKIKITPTKLGLLGTGAAGALTATISEAGYKGKFTEKTTCKGIATEKPTSGKGPSFKITVTPVKAGSCSITFADTNKQTAVLPVTGTTAALTIGATSISAHSASVKIQLLTVSGKAPAKGVVTTSIVNLTACTAGCTVAGPQSPPGSDVFQLSIYDKTGATGNVLATGKTTATVTVAKANVIAAAALPKIPKFLLFGAIPTGAAGTVFNHALTLSVQDIDHANITSGTFSVPVVVTDNDTSTITQGTALSLNGGASARSVSVLNATSTLAFKYGGLAIPTVTLTAAASGATSASGKFTPSVTAMVYTGPKTGSTPEIDLYNPASGQPGFSGSFTLSQTGWSGGSYGRFFAYTLGGASNNCSSFTISAASGTAVGYTASVKNSSSVAGTCVMSLTGAPGSVALTVILTYTTGSIGINAKHHKP